MTTTRTPLQVLSEPRRQAILRLVWDRERSAGDISRSFDVSFSAVSQHLARMLEAEVVSVRRDGRQRFYLARKDKLGPLATYLEAMWTEKLDQLQSAIEAEEGESP
jgi:DNA-binding transcriptional ArsR family regulator